VLRQPFMWAGHAQGLAIIADNNLVAWAWAGGPGLGQAALGMIRQPWGVARQAEKLFLVKVFTC
jgi:hypothetical protein